MTPFQLSLLVVVVFFFYRNLPTRIDTNDEGSPILYYSQRLDSPSDYMYCDPEYQLQDEDIEGYRCCFRGDFTDSSSAAVERTCGPGERPRDSGCICPPGMVKDRELDICRLFFSSLIRKRRDAGFYVGRCYILQSSRSCLLDHAEEDRYADTKESQTYALGKFILCSSEACDNCNKSNLGSKQNAGQWLKCATTDDHCRTTTWHEATWFSITESIDGSHCLTHIDHESGAHVCLPLKIVQVHCDSEALQKYHLWRNARRGGYDDAHHQVADDASTIGVSYLGLMPASRNYGSRGVVKVDRDQLVYLMENPLRGASPSY
ncbi:hypothetical protein M419DRAFT_36862 [Trichoderma reesei RUT C-30]|uniref:Uncharacterized protein n=1 Tax=Hypocrea jecorina (strain ATCC 56765 / BCRC 32924 / NRRL 11460 / Rut C-30) TaxID=1344414 RepID=A0A024S7M1_HYPJR|nr:hypothetical protein M419DRAFT_36862 [Trichoderma reesei RUT C-30]